MLMTLYSHKYQQLPLISAEEFLAQHPDQANSDENELMYARIEHERIEREALEQRRQELLKRKQKLIAENTRRKDDLANLDQDLEKFIDVSSSCHKIASNIILNMLILPGCETDPGAFRKSPLKRAVKSRLYTTAPFRASDAPARRTSYPAIPQHTMWRTTSEAVLEMPRTKT